jgi:hypothetical protein
MNITRTGPLGSLAAALALACSAGGDGDEDVSVNPQLGGDAFSSIYASAEFQECSGCHAPEAPGRTEGTEATQDWSTRDSAYASLQGTASGLIGNFSGCNGVPFLGPTAEESLLVAAFDEDVRAAYDNPSFPECDGAAISDQTLKIGGPLPPGLLAELKAWVDAGAPDR